MKLIKVFSLTILFNIFFLSFSFGEVVKEIKVNGKERITDEIISMFSGIEFLSGSSLTGCPGLDSLECSTLAVTFSGVASSGAGSGDWGFFILDDFFGRGAPLKTPSIASITSSILVCSSI